MPWTPLDWRASAPGSKTLAVPRGHGHNDYDQANPLDDALDAGCTSVGVDVFLVSGELRIGHTIGETQAGRTLTSEYLNHPRVLELDQLMIDMKGNAAYTREQQFAAIVAAVTAHTATSSGALPVIVSGSRPAYTTLEAHPSWVQFDGNMNATDLAAPSSAVPIISMDWTDHLQWAGSGQMTVADERIVWNLSARAFENGKQLRFWGTANNTAVWRQLWRAGVDWIGADNLPAFKAWRDALPT